MQAGPLVINFIQKVFSIGYVEREVNDDFINRINKCCWITHKIAQWWFLMGDQQIFAKIQPKYLQENTTKIFGKILPKRKTNIGDD